MCTSKRGWISWFCVYREEPKEQDLNAGIRTFFQFIIMKKGINYYNEERGGGGGHCGLNIAPMHGFEPWDLNLYTEE